MAAPNFTTALPNDGATTLHTLAASRTRSCRQPVSQTGVVTRAVSTSAAPDHSTVNGTGAKHRAVRAQSGSGGREPSGGRHRDSAIISTLALAVTPRT